MQIDPHAWLLTLPLTLALFRVGTLPADHWFRTAWRSITDRETLAWNRFGLQDPAESAAWVLITRVVMTLCISALGVASMLSLASFVMHRVG